jgi:hypothetical protein
VADLILVGRIRIPCMKAVTPRKDHWLAFERLVRCKLLERISSEHLPSNVSLSSSRSKELCQIDHLICCDDHCVIIECKNRCDFFSNSACTEPATEDAKEWWMMYFAYSHEKECFIPKYHGLKWNFRKKKRCLFNYLSDSGTPLPTVSFILLYSTEDETTVHEASSIQVEDLDTNITDSCEIIPVRISYEFGALTTGDDTSELDDIADELQRKALRGLLWEALAPLSQDE